MIFFLSINVHKTIAMWKLAKGACDLIGDDYNRIKYLIKIIEEQFVLNGGKPLETPVFERTDVLMKKYGEEADTKLVYNIEENGGEPLTLRYDLTIPFVRYVKENGVQKMRRYAIGKVYRRDQPNVKNGRYREFYQADFDILGEDANSMITECNLLQMASTILNKLGLDYKIIVNDVQNLENILVNIVNVPIDRWKAMCPIIDKLDKQPFDELIEQFKNVYSDIDVSRLKAALSLTEPVCEDTKTKWKKLLDLANVFDFADKLSFTSSLARGLDYYSGFIWEVKVNGFDSSVIAGGRYDNLIKKSLVGISFGVSRMLSLVNIPEENEWNNSVYVTSIGNVNLLDRMKVVAWTKKKFPEKPVVFGSSEKDRKLVKVIEECIQRKTRYIIIVGEDEWKNDKIIMKDLSKNTQEILSLDM